MLLFIFHFFKQKILRHVVGTEVSCVLTQLEYYFDPRNDAFVSKPILHVAILSQTLEACDLYLLLFKGFFPSFFNLFSHLPLTSDQVSIYISIHHKLPSSHELSLWCVMLCSITGTVAFCTVFLSLHATY